MDGVGIFTHLFRFCSVVGSYSWDPFQEVATVDFQLLSLAGISQYRGRASTLEQSETQWIGLFQSWGALATHNRNQSMCPVLTPIGRFCNSNGEGKYALCASCNRRGGLLIFSGTGLFIMVAPTHYWYMQVNYSHKRHMWHFSLFL